MIRKLAFLLLAAAAVAPVAAESNRPFTIAETGQRFTRLRDAVNAIGDGQGTIRIAPGRYRDCAVQNGGRIAYVAEQAGTAIFDGGICEGKAVLVLDGESAHVEGLVFTRMQVPDGNGAGIRIEQGDLNVSQSLFIDGQSGILSATDPDGSIVIDRSTFSGLGRDPDGDGSHAVYIGRYGSLRVTNSRFERGTGGHYLKSRAPRIEVLDSSFDDSAGQGTNYLIDLPNGAVGRIAGNVFLNGAGKDNWGTMIAVAAEGSEQPSAGLVIERNEVALAPGFRWATAFVGNWSGERLVVRDNRVRGNIALLQAR